MNSKKSSVDPSETTVRRSHSREAETLCPISASGDVRLHRSAASGSSSGITDLVNEAVGHSHRLIYELRVLGLVILILANNTNEMVKSKEEVISQFNGAFSRLAFRLSALANPMSLIRVCQHDSRRTFYMMINASHLTEWPVV